ncbi:MAG: nucleotidyl transferase AbiEii/AbiGii toxin family protein [Candidatus Lokiarchaeota archaeon]|nr:nucleotidyl transferase AbiEii/AbiGii toxin family protein [Candidatus Lokiarchaeota archaeon]
MFNNRTPGNISLKETLFYRQAELLLQILPFFKQEKVFALKGGTAINFFHRNLPRLSVDIDLTYLPINKRDTALSDISRRLENVSGRIIKQFPNGKIIKKTLSGTDHIIGLIFKREQVSVKIEPNNIVRGAVYPIEQIKLCKSVREKFEMTLSMQTLSLADLYGSKICAALDRQHPRDLFDVHFLLKNEGITGEIRKAFIVYLISHPRPLCELLNPNYQKIDDVYEKEFKGMIFEKTSLKDLIQTQRFLFQSMKSILTADEKQFLISFKSLDPQWDLLGLNNIQRMPGVKWKLLNLEKMSKTKHQQAVGKLVDCLNG